MTDQIEGIGELVKAANRTTHAVRAIARFLLIETISAIAGTIAFALGSPVLLLNPPLGWLLVIVGIIVWIVGIIWAITAALQELSLSEVPGVAVNSPVDWMGAPQVDGPPTGLRVPSGTVPEIKPVDPGRAIYFRLSVPSRNAWKAAGEPPLTDWNQSIESFEDWLARSSS